MIIGGGLAVNFVNLEYFLVVAEELNITRAAERLYMSQQSLSSHIRRLEQDFDTKLFERTPTLSLTYSGRKLARAAAQILEIKRQVTEEIDDINHRRRGNIRVGISHTRGRVLLSDILPGFKKAYPYVELSVLEGNSVELENSISRGGIDLMIGFAPIMVSDIVTVPLLTERLFLCISRTMLEQRFPGVSPEELHQRMETVSITDFADLPFLMMTPGNQIRTMLDTLCVKEGINPSIFLETENIETLLALCIKGMGITFYPELFVKDIGLPFEKPLNNGEVFFFPLSDPITMGHLVIGYRQNTYLSDVTRAFIEFVKDTYRQDGTADGEGRMDN